MSQSTALAVDPAGSKEQISSGTGTDSDIVKPPAKGGDEEKIVDDDQSSTQEEDSAPVLASDAPDGGLAAWLCVLGAWCTGFCSFGWINSIGVFQDYYQTGPLQTYSPSTISWIPSLQIFFMSAMGPIVGYLFDRWGPRPLILVGSFLHVFGLMMASISTQYYQYLLSQGVCSAIGVSAILQPSMNSLSGWFDKKRGTAFGVFSTGSSIGGIIFPIMVSRLIRSNAGYGWAMRAAAFLILGLLTIANLTVRSRFPPERQRRQEKQLAPLTAAEKRALMAKPFREPGFIFLMLGMGVLTFGIFAPITYLQVQASQSGMDPNIVQYLVAIFNTGSLVGRIISGIAADRIGRYNVFGIACTTAGILTLALWIKASSDGALIAFAVLFGFFSGAYVSLIGALVAQVSPLPEIGFRMGIVFLMASVPGLVSSPIAGAILAGSGGWTGLKAFAGSFIVGGTVLMMLARMVYTKFKLWTIF